MTSLDGARDVAAVPRFATPRDPRFATLGPAAVRLAHVAGWPRPMRWNRDALDVALEVAPDRLGVLRYRYPVVVITVPRQNSKTTLAKTVIGHRLTRARQLVLGVAG